MEVLQISRLLLRDLHTYGEFRSWEAHATSEMFLDFRWLRPKLRIGTPYPQLLLDACRYPKEEVLAVLQKIAEDLESLPMELRSWNEFASCVNPFNHAVLRAFRDLWNYDASTRKKSSKLE